MEEMETEGLTPNQIYRPQDVVWVKLSAGGMWWPSMVQNMTTLEPEITAGLKKQPLVVVKFLHEDTYEFVRSYDHIYHYNCKRKEDFLKHGFKKYYKLNKEKNMAKFPEDVQEAERLTGGDPEITKDPKYLPQEAFEQGKVDNGGRSSLPADFKGRKASAPRMSAPAPSGDGDATGNSKAKRLKNVRPAIVKQGPSWYPYPKFFTVVFPRRKPPSDDASVKQVVLQKCNKCCFETLNFELFMLHNQYNQHSTMIQPGKYQWRNPGSVRKPGSGVKKPSVRAKKDGRPKSAEKKSAKKKKKVLPPIPVGEFTPPKKPKMSSPGTPNSHEVSQEYVKIIEEWTDDEEENKPSDETVEDLLDCTAANDDTILETTAEAAELKMDEEKQPTLDTTPQKADKPSDPPKSSSCFDFDEEEPAEPGLQSSGKFGQIRLPRVITPEKSKPPDLLGDGNDIDSLLKEVSVPEIPTLPPSKQDSLFSRGDRTYGSSPFKDTKKPSIASPVKSDSNNDMNADTENNRNEEKHFLAEGPLQSKKRKSFGLTEGAEDGSAGNKKVKVGTSPEKPSNQEVVAPRDIGGETSQIAAETSAAERAKQSLIDTLTHSPKTDDEVADESKTVEQKCDEPNESLLNDNALGKSPNCTAPRPNIERINKMVECDWKPENQVETPLEVPCEASEASKLLGKSGVAETGRVVDNQVETPLELPCETLELSKPIVKSEFADTRGDVDNQVEPPLEIPCETSESSKALAKSEVADTKSIVDKEKDLTTSNLKLKSSPLGESGRQSSHHGAPSESKIHPPGDSTEVEAKKKARVALAHDHSSKNYKLDTDSSTTEENLTEFIVSAPTPCDKEKYRKVTTVDSSVDIPQDESKQAPVSRKSKRDNSFHQYVPEVSNQLPKHEELQKDVIGEKPSQEVPDNSSHPITRRKRHHNQAVPESPALPGNEIREVDDITKHKAQEECRAISSETRAIQQVADTIVSPNVELININRDKSGPSGDVSKAEDISCHEVQDSTKLFAVKVEAENTDIISDVAPTEPMENLKSSPSRKSNRNKKVTISEPSKLLPDNETTKADGDAFQRETRDMAESRKTGMIDQVTDSIIPPKLSRRSMKGKSVFTQSLLEQVKLPQGEVGREDIIVREMQEASLIPLSGKEEAHKTDGIIAGPPHGVPELVKSPPSTPSERSHQSKKGGVPKQANLLCDNEIAKADEDVILQDTLETAEPTKTAILEQVTSSQGEIVKVEDIVRQEQPVTDSKPLSGMEETQKIDDIARYAVDVSIKSLTSSCRISTRNKVVHSQDIAELRKSPEDTPQSKEALEAAVNFPESIQSAPKPSRRSTRNKSMSQEPTESASLRVDRTLKRDATTEEPETPRSSRSNKKFKSSKETLEPQPFPVGGISKADVTLESAETMKSPSSDQTSPSNYITQETMVQRTARASRKTKKLGSEEVSKMQPGNSKLEAVLEKVPQEVAECLKSPSRVITSKGSPEIDEPHKSSRRSQRNRSQEVPVSIPLPEVCLPNLATLETAEPKRLPEDTTQSKEALEAAVDSPEPIQFTPKPSRRNARKNEGKCPHENPELSGSPSHEAPSTLISQVSPKVESTQSSRRSRRISSQEVPVSIPLPKGDLLNDTSTSKTPQEVPQSLKSPTRDEPFQVHESSQGPSPMASKKSKKNTSTQEVSKPLPEENLLKDDAAVSGLTTFVESTRSSRTNKKSRVPPQSLKSPTRGESPRLSESLQDSSKVDESPKASKKSKKNVSAQEVPVSQPLPKENLLKDSAAVSDFITPEESHRSSRANKKIRAPLEIPQSLKSPTRDEPPQVNESSQGSSKVDGSSKASKKSKKSLSTREVPVSIPLPEENLPKDGAAISDSITPEESPRSSSTIKKIRAPNDAVELKSRTSDETLTITPKLQEGEATISFSTDKTSAVIVADDKANENLQSSKKSDRHKLSEDLHESKSISVEELVTIELKDELKPTESPTDERSPAALKVEARRSKSPPPPAETPNNVEGKVAAEISEPLKPPSIDKTEVLEANEPLPSRESIRIPCLEVSTSVCKFDTPRIDSTSSGIHQDSRKLTKQLFCDEALTSKSSQEDVPLVQERPELTPKGNRKKGHKAPEATPAIEQDKPPVAGVVLSQEPCEDLLKQFVDRLAKEDSPKATSKKSKSVSKKAIESKLLPESITPKPDGGHKKVSSKVTESRSASKEAKSKKKDRNEYPKSHRGEKSGRESRSTFKNVRDISKGSSREDKSRSESRTSKRETASKEKQRKDKDEVNSAPRLKPASHVDVHSTVSVVGASAMEQGPSVITEKLESPKSRKDEVAKNATSPSKHVQPTHKLVPQDSARKKRSKCGIETPKGEEIVAMETVETGKDVESAPVAIKNAVETPPPTVKPLAITVFDSKNEIVVDTDLSVSSPKKQMAHSPSKTFRNDEAASLLEELLGSSPKSSPTSSPKKAKATSPVKVAQGSPTQRTADIKFSLSPSKVLDFGSPSKANNVVESISENPPLSPSKSPKSGLTDASPAPVRASRWDSPFPPVKSSMLSAASSGKTPQSPGRKVKFEIQSGLGRSCFKSSPTEKNVALDAPPKLPVRLEPYSSNNQSDDELSALQAEIMSYSAMDKVKSTVKEVSDSVKKIEDSLNSVQSQASTPTSKSLSKKTQDKKDPLLSPTKFVDTKTSLVSPGATHQPPQPAIPVKLPGLSEADLLASLDDAISFPLDEPTAESIRSLSSDTVSSTKPSNAPILITVPSDSMQGTDSAIEVVGTERQAVGNGLAEGFGSGADLLVMDLDINSIPIIMPDDLTQEERMFSYSDSPVTGTESTPNTAAPIAATEPVSSIPLPSLKRAEQPPPVSSIPSASKTLGPATSGQVRTSSVPSVTPVHLISLPPEPSTQDVPAPEVSEALREEIIETEIVMDHSETEQQNSETSVLSLEEKFEQALVKQPWLRPDLLKVMTKGATEKKVYHAKKVTQLVISLYDEDHPDYSYYMSLPPCQVGTSNFTKSWAAVGPSKTATVTLLSSTDPPKTVSSLTKPTLTSATSVRQISTSSHTPARQVLSVDKSKSIVTVARPEKVGEVILADSSTKPVIVGTQSLAVPASAVRQAGTSPVKAVGSQVKQQLLQLLNKAQSGELDPETARKLNDITSNPVFLAKINKQHRVMVSSRPSADIQQTGLVAKPPTVRASPTAKIVSSIPGSSVVVSKPIVVAAVSTPVTQPKSNVLTAAARVAEPLKFTMESKFRNIQIASNSPRYVVACDPVTGIPAVKSQIVIGRNPNTVSAGPSRSTVPSTMQNVTAVSARSTITSPTQTIVVTSGLTIPSKAQTANVVNPGSSTVKLSSVLPRPRIVQRVKTVAQPGSVVPSARLPQPQAVRLRKQALPHSQGQATQVVRPAAKPETFTYVTITNNMVIPTSSEQVYVMNKNKPSVAPGSDILAKALADTDILPSDSEPFNEDSSPNLFSPASVVITGSLGTDQPSITSFDPAKTSNVNR